MAEYIERKAAIEAVKKERDYIGKFTFEEEHAIGRSPSYPRGWVSAKDLLVLARMVEAKDPLNFYYSVRSNLPTGGERNG